MKFLAGVIAALFAVANTEVIPFDNKAIEKIFQNKKPALLLFASDNEESTTAKEALKGLDEAGTDELVLSVSEANDGHGLFERLAEYVGVDVSTTPKFLYLGEKQEKYNFDGEATKDNLATFVSKVKAGEIEQFLKSAPIPETNDEPVKIGVGKNFKNLVLDNDKEVLVKFYAPWCGHCKHLAPHYDEAAKRIQANPNIILVKVDSTLNEVSGVDIQGFPTLKFYGKDKSKDPIDFNGGRDADGIISWLKEHTEYDWVEPAAASETKEETAEEL